MLILDDLLINIPAKIGLDVVRKIRDMAEDELYDPERIKNSLAELNQAYEAGEVDKEEFEKLEKKLLKRLEIGLERKWGGRRK